MSIVCLINHHQCCIVVVCLEWEVIGLNRKVSLNAGNVLFEFDVLFQGVDQKWTPCGMRWRLELTNPIASPKILNLYLPVWFWIFHTSRMSPATVRLLDNEVRILKQPDMQFPWGILSVAYSNAWLESVRYTIRLPPLGFLLFPSLHLRCNHIWQDLGWKKIQPVLPYATPIFSDDFPFSPLSSIVVQHCASRKAWGGATAAATCLRPGTASNEGEREMSW